CRSGGRKNALGEGCAEILRQHGDRNGEHRARRLSRARHDQGATLHRLSGLHSPESYYTARPALPREQHARCNVLLQRTQARRGTAMPSKGSSRNRPPLGAAASLSKSQPQRATAKKSTTTRSSVGRARPTPWWLEIGRAHV